MEPAGFIHITCICYTTSWYLLTALRKWLNQPFHQQAQTLLSSTDFSRGTLIYTKLWSGLLAINQRLQVWPSSLGCLMQNDSPLFHPNVKKKRLVVTKLPLIYISRPLTTQDTELGGKARDVHRCRCCHPPERSPWAGARGCDWPRCAQSAGSPKVPRLQI